MIRAACFAFCVITFTAAQKPDIVERINSMQTTWKARHYESTKHMRLGVPNDPKIRHALRQERLNVLDVTLPDAFDARDHWPECVDVIGNIRDQSDCGSCWAVSSASAFSDRKCIFSNGKIHTSFSAEDTLACCQLEQSLGCEGGFPDAAWDWFVNVGVVSGGNYTNKLGCRPYLFCPPKADNCVTPNCRKFCDGTMKPSMYNKDKHKALTSFTLPANNTEQMQLEVYKNGSIVVSFAVYEDFYNYESGVYQRTAGAELVGYHAVRLLGWGTEKDLPYWLIANSWNADWGENGYFRILRGYDECGIEEDPVAGDVPAS